MLRSSARKPHLRPGDGIRAGKQKPEATGLCVPNLDVKQVYCGALIQISVQSERFATGWTKLE